MSTAAKLTFPEKLTAILCAAMPDGAIRWSPQGDAVVIHDTDDAGAVISQYFSHSNV